MLFSDRVHHGPAIASVEPHPFSHLTMTRVPNHLKLLPLLLCTLATFASVQTVSAQVALGIESINGSGGNRTTNEEIQRGLNIMDCEGDATITVGPRVSTTIIPTGGVDIWIGDADCSSAMERTREDKVCEWVAHPSVVDASFTLTMAQILAAQTNYCQNNGASKTVYVLFTEVERFEGEITQYGTFGLVVDGIAPSAPTPDQTAVTGDSQVELSWDLVEAESRYAVIRGGACGSNMPNFGSSISEVGLNVRRTTISPASLGLSEGESTAVHLITEDEAGNVSEASAEICVTRVSTVGYCDVYEAMGGQACEDGCSVADVSRSPLFALLFLFGLALSRRR